MNISQSDSLELINHKLFLSYKKIFLRNCVEFYVATSGEKGKYI